MLKIWDANNFRRTGAGLCLILAPLVLFGTDVIDVHLPEDDPARAYPMVAAHTELILTTTLLSVLAMVLLVPAIFGLAHLLRGNRVATALGHVGAGLTLIGAFGYAILRSWNVFSIQMVAEGADKGQMIALYERVSTSFGGAVIPFMFLVGAFLGLIVLAAALWWARISPRWAAPLIFLSMVGSFFTQGNTLAQTTSDALLLVGLGVIGLKVLAMSDADWKQGRAFSVGEEVAGVGSQPRVQ